MDQCMGTRRSPLRPGRNNRLANQAKVSAAESGEGRVKRKEPLLSNNYAPY